VETEEGKEGKMIRLLLLLLLLGVSHVKSFIPSSVAFLFKGSAKRRAVPHASNALVEVPIVEYLTTDGATSKLDGEELQQRIRGITTIASDVDGTLLGSDHTLSTFTKNAIEVAVREVSKPNGRIRYFFPATGKSRKGALDSLGADTRALLEGLPGVFLQGLYCVDGNGTVIFERQLPHTAVVAAEALAAKFNTTIIANCGDIIYSNPEGHAKQLDEVNRLWGEPIPTIIESLSNSTNDVTSVTTTTTTRTAFNKLVFMHDNVDMLHDELRPQLEALAHEVGATVTTSFPTILEVLPKGCSKALGVQKLCEYLGIRIGEELLAMGDAENDKGMLELAAIGVAMGNASPVAKAAADVVMKETSDEGAAGLAMERYSLLTAAPTKTTHDENDDNVILSPTLTVQK
jgi:Cof subfamily protein (haloacid dehalogenase superfamily)